MNLWASLEASKTLSTTSATNVSISQPSPDETDPPINEHVIDTSSVRTLKEIEHDAIVAGLERTDWNMTTTSQQLGISRMTLYRKLDQHGLRKKD